MTDRQEPSSDASSRTSIPRWRRITGITLIALGALLAPVAILSSWAVTQLADTDRFVATFGPLGANDEVQSYVADQVTSAIEEQVDFPALIDPFFDSLTSDAGPLANAAVGAVRGLAEQAARQLVAGAVSRVVESDAFATIWRESLRVSHGTLVSVLSGQSSIVSLADDGTIGIELGPIVDEVKQSLVDGGLGFAAQLPDVDRTIPVATAESLVTLRAAYSVALTVGFWLPWLVVALVIGGLLLVAGGLRSIILSAGGVALGMAVLLLGLAIGRAVALHELDVLGLPPLVAAALFDNVVGGIVTAAAWALVLAFVIAGITWLLGPFDLVGRLRRWREGTAMIKDSA